MKTKEEILEVIQQQHNSMYDLMRFRDSALTNESYWNYQRSIDECCNIIRMLEWVIND